MSPPCPIGIDTLGTGEQGSLKGASTRKSFVSNMYKYALFDMKPTYNQLVEELNSSTLITQVQHGLSNFLLD